MIRRKLQGLLQVAVILLVTTSSVGAQWTKIARHLFDAQPGGCITFCDGLLWIANDNIYLSADTGRTWTVFSLPDPAMNGVAYDIQFYDRSTGIAAFPGGTYITTDQGVTWNLLKAGTPFSVAFGTTSQIIGTAEEYQQGVNISTDGGQTWNFSQLKGAENFKILGLKDGSFDVFCSTPASPGFTLLGGYMYNTTDNGLTWKKRLGQTDFDCYDFCTDSCDPNLIFIPEVNSPINRDDSSNVLMSSDGGDTWNSTFKHIAYYFAGGIAESKSAVYAQTFMTTDPSTGFPINNGILRTTNKGLSWKNIAGPSNDQHTRFISAINDNIVFAADIFGNVWRTTNSGGDSILTKAAASYAFYPDSVAGFDSLAACDSSLSDTILLIRHCAAFPIASLSITGKDSSLFMIVKSTNPDSIVVLFSGGPPGVYSAALRLDLSDGSHDSLLLSGFGRQSGGFSFTTSDVQNDTIGGTVFIPIYAHGAIDLGDLSFRVNFDTSMLVYVGAYSVLDFGTDHTNSKQLASASVRIPANAIDWKDDPIGYVVFNVFPTTDSCTVVTFDSINILHRFVRGLDVVPHN